MKQTTRLLVAATGLLGVLLIGLVVNVVRPDRMWRDEATLDRLAAQLEAETPQAERRWNERFQTGSGGATLYALALVPDTEPPEGVHVFRLTENGVVEDQGLYEGQVYEPDCHSCAPRSIAMALEEHPGLVVWSRQAEAVWFD